MNRPVGGLRPPAAGIGFPLRVEWLWRQPLPTLIDMLGWIPRS
ncbi:MAG: hypothetical protein AAGE94_23620 [Acidobacteriota bacterium]